MRFATTVAAAAVVAGVTASPINKASSAKKVHTIPLKQVNNAKSFRGLVEAGRARIAHINGKEIKTEASSGSVTNEDVSYVAQVGIGSNSYSLIVDTGSSNLWCGARGSCEPGSGGQSTGNSVKVSYGSGSFSGTEYTDSASFGGLTVNSQSLGAASTATGFNGVDGIIGFGPVDLTQNTVSNTNTVPTFMDNLYSQGTISTEVLGVSFRPESGSDSDDSNGELTLGGTDSSKYSGSIEYFPTATSGSNAPYWGLGVSGFSYSGNNLGGAAAAIVDTGTTLIYIPTSSFSAFLSATGGTNSNGMAEFSSAPTGNFNINVGGSQLTLTPDQYLVPESQYSEFGLTSGSYYSWISQGGSSGVDCIIGQKFLENYYSVFDTTNSRIGFAPAS